MKTELSKSQANELRKQLHNIRDKKARTDLEFCGMLWRVYYSSVVIGKERVPIYTFWGHSSWEEFAEQEVGLHGNTAHSYRRVWELFMVRLKGAWDKKLLVGITKMKILCQAELTEKNVEAWLRDASKLTCCALEAKVYGHRASRTLSVRLELQDINRLKTVLDANKELFDTDNRGDVLVGIIEEWSNARGAVRRLRKVG